MDDFIRKKILYYLKSRYDKDPDDIVNLVGQMEIEINVLVRNVRYLAGMGLIEHHDYSFGNDDELAQIRADGITFVENDYRENHEENVLEVMKEHLEKGTKGLNLTHFPEYLFPNRMRLASRLLQYRDTRVAFIHCSGRMKDEIDLIIPNPGLIAYLEDLKRKREMSQSFYKSRIETINIANIGRMDSSQIQQGTTESVQQGEFKTGDRDEFVKFLELLKEKIPELHLNSEDKSELDTNIQTIEVQLQARRPKAGIIKECLTSIRKILESATGGVIAAELVKYLPALLSLIGG